MIRFALLGRYSSFDRFFFRGEQRIRDVTRDTAIVVPVRHQHPALALLAPDVCFASPVQTAQRTFRMTGRFMTQPGS